MKVFRPTVVSACLVLGCLIFVAHEVSADGPRVTLLKDTYAGATSGNPGDSGQSGLNGTVMNGVLYFPANSPFTGIELWRTDGTTAGTFVLKDINPGAGSSEPDGLIV